MKRILISINPEHVAKILSGEKRFECRRKTAKMGADSLLIYETVPMKKVVAEAEIIEVIALPPKDLWEKTKEHSGIAKEFFARYYGGREMAYAYHLGKVKVFETPRELSFYGIKAAPQSFVYVNA